jgi:hypothetical protein
MTTSLFRSTPDDKKIRRAAPRYYHSVMMVSATLTIIDIISRWW